MNLPAAREFIINLLQKGHRPSLFYHTIEHTLDVQRASAMLIGKEKVDEHTGLLIETAALFHDSGMTIGYKDHETTSAEIASRYLPDFSYTAEEIAIVRSLVMVTRLPQQAKTLPEQILCDADLDNLGRDDFFINSFRLKLEWELNGIMTCSLARWMTIQKEFLEEHNYYTPSALHLRQEKKLKNLAEINELIKH
jgi:uncharacterized protein